MNAPLLDERVEAAAAVLGPLARRAEPIGVRTTYRVGGAAALFVEVGSDADLESVALARRASGLDVLVLGIGSNLLVADGGFPGLCVSLGPAYATARLDPDGRVDAGAALAYPLLARRCAHAALRGLEWAVGIPGSVGGAVAMNAGGHGAETADRLQSARVAHLLDGTVEPVPLARLGLGYRRSSLQPTDLVLGATFTTTPGDAGAAEHEIETIVRWRHEHQPGGRNGGSVFSNPPGDAAGRLIEEAGLKGRRIGSAAVSEKHANFIQCDADGSADDVYRLLVDVRAEVERRLGVLLVPELRLIGFPE
jgi:UDP-N-acetylmuramate dehydrogenase